MNYIKIFIGMMGIYMIAGGLLIALSIIQSNYYLTIIGVLVYMLGLLEYIGIKLLRIHHLLRDSQNKEAKDKR